MKISDESISTKVSAVSAISSTHGVHDHPHHQNDNVSSCNTADTTKTVGVVANRKAIIDETLLPPEEAEKILARRAYNRDCATRARKRSKQIVTQLEKQVKELQEDKDALRRSLVTMEKQMVELESQNKELKLKQMLTSSRVGGMGMTADPLAMGSAIGSGLPASSMLQQQQLQLLQQKQHAAKGGDLSCGGGVNLAQLSCYMNGQNGYF
jgi:hypothetical protein